MNRPAFLQQQVGQDDGEDSDRGAQHGHDDGVQVVLLLSVFRVVGRSRDTS